MKPAKSTLVTIALNAGAARGATYIARRPEGFAAAASSRKLPSVGHRCDRRNGRSNVARRAIAEGRA